MKLDQRNIADVSLVTVEGRLDHETTPKLEKQVERCGAECAGRGASLVLDLARVTYVSSIALRCIFRLARNVAGAGGTVVLASLQPVVREIFTISGLDQRIAIRETVEDAIAELSSTALSAYHVKQS